MFTQIESDIANHGVLFAADAAPLLELGSGQLTQLSAVNPKGVEAIKKVQEVWLTLDWETQPVLDLQLKLPEASAAGDLAAMINFFLGFGKSIPAINSAPGAAALLTQLKAKPSEQGVGLRLEIPKQDADAFLQRIESGGMPAMPR